MARIHRRRDDSAKGTWRQALVFNSLLLVLALLSARVLANAYTPESVGDISDVQATTETRREIDKAFETIVPAGTSARAFWADQIAQELAAQDYSAARGFLLAAPVMLNRDDARALMAAADAEETGSHDDRLTRAGLLFLPNDVRASYQRSVERPSISISPGPASAPEVPAPADGPDDPADTASKDTPDTPQPTETDTTDKDIAPEAAPNPAQPASFSLVGGPADLARRSQRWVNGDPVDSTQLRLSAISLIRQDDPDRSEVFTSATSVLRAASRANRLSDNYAAYLRERVDLAMPEAETLAAVRQAMSGVTPVSEMQTRVLAAYQGMIDPAGIARLERDLRSISLIADYTSPSGAVTLLETAQSPEDVKKLQLVAQAGGDRAVALSRHIGPRVTDLAQIGVKWSTSLIAQILALLAIFSALCWTTSSAISRMRPVQSYRR